MKSAYLATLLGASMLCSSAFAQSAPAQSTTTAPAATTSTNQQKMLKGKWRASKLMGLDVYNQNNEKLGDINEFILDKDGKVQAVVIGVGGFLGMGEHDVAVTMDKLQFVEEARKTTTSNASPTTTTPRPATAPAGTTTGATTTAVTTSNDWAPDHAVMNGTKEQLKAMPQFKYSDYN